MSESDLVVLVTGTSSGFGRRIAQTLARRGRYVFASMRGVDGKNREAADDLRSWAETEGVSLQVVDLDITDQGSVDRAVDHILDTTGPIDVVVTTPPPAQLGYSSPSPSTR